MNWLRGWIMEGNEQAKDSSLAGKGPQTHATCFSLVVGSANDFTRATMSMRPIRQQFDAVKARSDFITPILWMLRVD